MYKDISKNTPRDTRKWVWYCPECGTETILHQPIFKDETLRCSCGFSEQGNLVHHLAMVAHEEITELPPELPHANDSNKTRKELHDAIKRAITSLYLEAIGNNALNLKIDRLDVMIRAYVANVEAELSQYEMPCPNCQGSGTLPEHVCQGDQTVCQSKCPQPVPCPLCGTTGRIDKAMANWLNTIANCDEPKTDQIPT